jgi:tRNA(fMet)-specific endonuclease VapC
VSLYILDTDTLSLYQSGHPRVVQQLLAHLPHRLAISVVTVEEQLAGWQRALSQARDDARRVALSQRMARAIEGLVGWSVIPLTFTILDRYADLVRLRLNVGANDLKIAATALEIGAIVVTRNRRDFGRVVGLPVEDWTI